MSSATCWRSLYGLASDSTPLHGIVQSLPSLPRRPSPHPSRVAVCIRLSRAHELWRTVHGAAPQNHPHSYHNGGLWPFVGGYWVLALQRLGLHRPRLAPALLQLACVNQLDDWRFTEWLNGQHAGADGHGGAELECGDLSACLAGVADGGVAALALGLGVFHFVLGGHCQKRGARHVPLVRRVVDLLHQALGQADIEPHSLGVDLRQIDVDEHPDAPLVLGLARQHFQGRRLRDIHPFTLEEDFHGFLYVAGQVLPIICCAEAAWNVGDGHAVGVLLVAKVNEAPTTPRVLR